MNNLKKLSMNNKETNHWKKKRGSWHQYSKQNMQLVSNSMQVNPKKKMVCSFQHIPFLPQGSKCSFSTNISMQAPSSAPESTIERCVLRSGGAKDSDNADTAQQPSKGIVGYNCFRL
jgi:hypothetical protein